MGVLTITVDILRMFVEDDNAGGVFSFGDIARQEATRISEALDAVQELLHQPQIEVIEEKEEPTVTTEGDMSDEGGDGFAEFRRHYRRYESAGYDAHSDCVDAAEVTSWQGAFPYLRIVGQRIPSHVSSSSSKATTQEADDVVEFIPAAVKVGCNQSASTVDMLVASDSQSMTPGWCDLVVEGRRMVIGQDPPPGFIADEGDVHGVLDELICIDVGSATDPSDARGGDDRPLSPTSSQHEEVMAILMDVVWPEVVDALQPLVREVVKLSRERGIVYGSEPDEPAVVDGGGGGWVESDDEF